MQKKADCCLSLMLMQYRAKNKAINKSWFNEKLRERKQIWWCFLDLDLEDFVQSIKLPPSLEYKQKIVKHRRAGYLFLILLNIKSSQWKWVTFIICRRYYWILRNDCEESIPKGFECLHNFYGVTILLSGNYANIYLFLNMISHIISWCIFQMIWYLKLSQSPKK